MGDAPVVGSIRKPRFDLSVIILCVFCEAPNIDPFTGMGWLGVTRIVAGRFVRFRAAEKSAKWRQMVTLRHCWHPRTLFLFADVATGSRRNRAAAPREEVNGLVASVFRTADLRC
jgi:hypothetical protein